jgi:alpha-mannosidase
LPLNIHSDNATYETQFGYVQRPTHKNTTWDAAKFEVCGHKYADLSEFGYGVAFLSESKYGFACEGNVLRISLLRAATAPDAEQDQGKHKFSWAVMPHQGHFLESDVPVAAYLFNSSLQVRYVSGGIDNSPLLNMKSPFQIEGASNVFLETVKRGDDDFGLQNPDTTVVLRLYEAYGGHGQAKLKVANHVPVHRAFVTNLLEDEIDELDMLRTDSSEGTVVELDFRGFEVKTVKLVIGTKELSGPVPQAKRESWVTVDKAFL